MKNTTNFDEINARIARVEMSVTRWRGMAIALSVALCFGVASGFTSQNSQTITAREFRVIDGEGKVMMNMSTSSLGPYLQQFDNDGNLRLSMSIRSGNPIVSMYNTENNVEMSLQADANGPGIYLLDKYKTERMKLMVLKDGPVIFQNNKDGDVQMSMVSLDDGPIITQSDDQGRIRFLASLQNGYSKIEQYNENHELINSTP